MMRVLVLPGDGVGREIMPLAVDVIGHAAGREGLEIDWLHHQCGAQTHLETGRAIASETTDLARQVDAVILGAVGLPHIRRPDGTEVADEVVLDLRSDLDLFANVRPVRNWPNVPGPLNRSDIDYTVVRENTEGLYLSRKGGVVLGNELAADTMIITRKGTERVVRHAFGLAMASAGRPCDGRRVVTCVDKANTLKGYVLFRTVFSEVAKEYPDVEAEYEYADAMTARMVLRPHTINVVVCENMLGDILSDLAAATVGGLGLAPSANVGDRHGLFEPTHGSAPDIAGKGISNPVATILSGAMMLEWLSSGDRAAGRAAARLRKAVHEVFEAGIKTREIGGSSTTAELAAAIKERIQ